MGERGGERGGCASGAYKSKSRLLGKGQNEETVKGLLTRYLPQKMGSRARTTQLLGTVSSEPKCME